MKDKYALDYPKKVRVGDISVREGLQHEEHYIPLEAKIYYVEESILAGFKRFFIHHVHIIDQRPLDNGSGRSGGRRIVFLLGIGHRAEFFDGSLIQHAQAV